LIAQESRVALRPESKVSAWVLLRGLTREARHWGSWVGEWEQTLNALDGSLAHWAAPIITVDLPGNGQFWAGRSPTRVEDMAQAARQHLRALGLEPPYGVVALSLGAMVAVAWAQADPQELGAAVLVNSSMKPFSRVHERLRPAAWPALLAMALGPTQPQAVEARILGLTSARWRTRPVGARASFEGLNTAGLNAAAPDEAPPEAVQALLSSWLRWRQECPVSRSNAFRQLVAAATFTAQRQAPAVPFLVLSSLGDTLVNPACSAAVAQAWGLPHCQHPWAGHDLPLDDGPWMARAIADWLSPGAPGAPSAPGLLPPGPPAPSTSLRV
jgi:pimeloyl-ACP methyl ester carboxylesterase